MDFSQVKSITIPEGSVSQILSGSTVLWKKPENILPIEYQQIEYLEGTGTQCIDTGYIPSVNTNIRLKKNATTGNEYNVIFGSGASVVNQYTVTNRAINYYTSINNYKSEQKEAGVLEVISGKFYMNSVEFLDLSSVTSGTSAYSLAIFCRKNSNTTYERFGSMKLYECKIWDSGAIVRNFVPCYRRADGVGGLYDLENGVFYTNAGTGTFAVGEDVVTLPQEYQQVTYLESTGTQRIVLTGPLRTNDRITVKASSLDSTAYGSIYGVNNFCQLYFNASYRVVAWRNCSIISDVGDVGQGEVHKIVSQITAYTYSNLVLFDYLENTVKYPLTGRLYSFTITRDNEPIYNLVPCYRKSDNVPGLYDVVNDQFYTNSGTGDFIKGPDV